MEAAEVRRQRQVLRRRDRRAADRRSTRRQIPSAILDPPSSRPFQSWYREVYLCSPHWRFVRAKKLEAQEARCERCGFQSYANDVHHLTYERLGAERLTDLAVLCRGCHEREHGKG